MDAQNFHLNPLDIHFSTLRENYISSINKKCIEIVNLKYFEIKDGLDELEGLLYQLKNVEEDVNLILIF